MSTPIALTGTALAIEKAGGASALARALQVHKSAVTQWKRDGLPAARVPEVSRLFRIPVEDLRPDLYGHGWVSRSHLANETQGVEESATDISVTDARSVRNRTQERAP